LSKLIVHAEGRESAIQRMIRALREYVILGVRTPIPFLIDVLQSAPFRAGETFTDFIERHFSDWQPDRKNGDLARFAFIVDEVSRHQKPPAVAGREGGYPAPWETLGNRWR
jgi:acetyl/propionyl-CoA carboxylase alpha subunit